MTACCQIGLENVIWEALGKIGLLFNESAAQTLYSKKIQLTPMLTATAAAFTVLDLICAKL